MTSIDKEILRSTINELDLSRLSSKKPKDQMKAYMENKITRVTSELRENFESKLQEFDTIEDDVEYFDKWYDYIKTIFDEADKPFGNHKSGTEKFLKDFVDLQKRLKESEESRVSEREKYEEEIQDLKEEIRSLHERTATNIESLAKRIETSKRIKIELEDSRKLNEVVVIDNATRSQESLIHCINNDIPVYITGPAGCGKSHDAELIARYLKLGDPVTYTTFKDGRQQQVEEKAQHFYPMNAVQQEYQIKGYKDANGYYHPTNFWKAFKFGGLLLLDELDSSIPEVLVILNFAIANHKFEFPDGNGTTVAHRDFRIIATGNTNGMGSDELYTGRYQLDAASLNRFAQMKYDYDEDTEISLISDENGNYDTSIIDAAHRLREICKSRKIPAIISYRQIMTVDRLKKSGMSTAEAWSMALFNGLDEETTNILLNGIGWLKK